MLKLFIPVFIYIGAIVGAGFASGQEIAVFFGMDSSGFGIPIAGFLFTLCAFRIFCDIEKYSITTYQQYLKEKTYFFSPFFNVISALFCCASYGIMVSGVNTVLENFNIRYGGIIFAGFCFVIFAFSLKGIEIVNLISTPLIISGMLTVGIRSVPVFADQTLKTTYYVAYNMLGCLPVLCGFRIYIKNKKQAVLVSVISGIILTLLMLIVNILTPMDYSEMPMLVQAKNLNLGVLYSAVLVLAMLTTAVSNGFGFIQSVKTKPLFSNIILFITALIMLSFGFAPLVEKVFVFFGVLSTALLFFVIF
ncbi:MAG: hypothetical protein IJE46_00480 [Clostridia bacterium]|nr:hypothetical protein [Clostridia bacterium]